MGMQARFAVATFAGILLGLVIIGSASLSPGVQLNGAADNAIFQTAATTTMTNSASTITSTTQFGIGNIPGTVTSTTTSALNPANSANGTGDYTANLTPSPSKIPASQMASITHQPPAMSLFVLLPILAAVLFGTLLYRASVVRESD